MTIEDDFNSATRKLLFKTTKEQELPKKEKYVIPGKGKSAVERPAKHFRVKVTMNLDADIISFFKQKGKQRGRSYQLLINEVLRYYMEDKEGETKMDNFLSNVSKLLVEDTSFIDKLKEEILKNN